MKQKRYWLRGGGILLAGLVILYLGLNLSGISDGGLWDLPISMFILLPGIIAMGFLGGHFIDGFEGYAIFIISAVVYFLIGAFIGWIYGIIKSRSAGINSQK